MPTNLRMPEGILSSLADPFDVFPLQDAMRGLEKLIEEYDNEVLSTHLIVIPKYRTVELEQSLEAISILMGAGFVTAQSILTRSHAYMMKLVRLETVQAVGGAGLPTTKKELFQVAAYDINGVSDIAGINALANYFKHATEWPYDWSTLNKPLEVETVKIITALGLQPGNPDNLRIGANALSFGYPKGLSKLAERIQDWREAVEKKVRHQLQEAGFY